MKIKTPDQIIRKIDLAKARHKKLVEKLAEAQCDYELGSESMDLAERRKAKEGIDRIERSIKRVENVRLKKLSAALAEILTVPLGSDQMVEGLDETEVTL